MSSHGSPGPEVPSITSAPEPLSRDIARRTRVYLWQMAVRVACFLLAVLLYGRAPVWVTLTLIAGAVVIPYVAVLMANAGHTRRDSPAPFLTPALLGHRDPHRAVLAGGDATPPGPAHHHPDEREDHQ